MKIDLNKRCFFILSGVRNILGKTLAVEMCRRFKPGSVAMLIEDCEETLQAIKKDIRALKNGIDVITYDTSRLESVKSTVFRKFLWSTLDGFDVNFDLAFILHNESTAATNILMEPQDVIGWKLHLEEYLYNPVALNQAFVSYPNWKSESIKLAINITSSIDVKPFMINNLSSSCKKAREMYFRAMANEERDLLILNFSPGILETHGAQFDINNNKVTLNDMNIADAILNLPPVKPLQSTLKLINILEEMSFISGHDVDYYDTYVL